MTDILTTIQAVQRKVMAEGFRYDDTQEAYQKLREEVTELEIAINQDLEYQKVDELGDVLYLAILLCTHENLDANQILAYALKKFNHRFLDMLSMTGGEFLAKELPKMSDNQKRYIWETIKDGDDNV